jgi:hypothetical protein
MVEHVVPIVITKLVLTYTNYGKIDHLMETYHNKKKKVQVVLIAIIKSI